VCDWGGGGGGVSGALHSGQRDSERHGGGDALVARQLGEGGVHLVGDALVLLLLVDELVCR